MRRGITRKWRPTLGVVVAVTLAVVLALPLGGIVAVRYLWPMMGEFGYQKAVIAVSALIVLAVSALGWVLVRLLLRPVQALAARGEAIKAGRDGALDPLPHYGTVEMQQMGQAMLDMGRVLQGREAVLRSYADHVTHELRSPLTVLRGAAELLDDEELSQDQRRQLIDRIDQATDRMSALLDAQRALARAQDPFAVGSCRLSRLVDGLRPEFPGLSLIVASDADLPLAADGLRLVLEHLLSNAAAHGARRVTLTATADSLRVADDGPGVSAGNRERIFDPFFTTRRDKGGTGMGLPIVRRMLQAHGADIELAEGPGAIFDLRF